MIKYQLAAVALKAFSLNSVTRKAYRKLGNVLGGKARSKAIKASYIQRAHENLRFIEERGGIADGMQLLELGTGWVHWESLFTRAFYDVRIILFDVWDNRQFDGFQHYARQLRERMAAEVDRDPAAIARAEALLDQVLACRSFDEVYALLGFTYLIDPEGSLKAIPDHTVDLMISSDVLEHVPSASVPTLARDLHRVLKPGGRSSNQIVFADHLCIYDRSVHPKNLLRYSKTAWKLLYGNVVQYVNRLQPSDFRDAFRNAGLTIVDEQVVESCNIDTVRVDRAFAHYSRDDLAVMVNRLMVENPA